MGVLEADSPDEAAERREALGRIELVGRRFAGKLDAVGHDLVAVLRGVDVVGVELSTQIICE